MANPVLVEVLRGPLVESRHRGAFAVVDAEGATLLAAGSIDRPVFPRSAVKAIQALPLVESGAADAFGYGERELALACASHPGEPAHAACAAAMLAAAGLSPEALECGAHWPSGQAAARGLAAAGEEPSALHNNCSGKHAGFLAVCRHLGLAPQGYTAPDHALQRLVRAALEAVTGAPHAVSACGIDGCSIPTYAVPLRQLAHGFARMASGTGLKPERAAAARRLFAACAAQPFFVAGSERFDTTVLGLGGGRLFVKTGAEGVYCGALPERGLGIAVKCDDGATRAAEVTMAALLARLLGADDPLGARLAGLARPTLTNWRGRTVGALRPAGALAKAGQDT